ncbi:MAG: uracil-DNA glycosylase [Chloroflexi bacterium]|nr:uracil-DNA glycosylase [Chloroflexota bacterium]
MAGLEALTSMNRELLECRRCPRLVAWREQVATEKRRAYRAWEYWGKPVPGFGDPRGRVFVVGLAPGAHGSNRTGRQFTGDASGDFLYPALYRAGFASQPISISRTDRMTLTDLYTAPVCRCAPPGNKPAPEEIRNCLPYLQREFELVRPRIYVALGRIAFDALLTILKSPSAPAFSHGAAHRLAVYPDRESWLLASYHPSRQNTQTGRLTENMFDEIWEKVHGLLEGSSC